MARRLNVTLDKHEGKAAKFVPHIVENIEADEPSVEKWSDLAIEQMFEAAEKALKKRAD
jgi:lipoate-protein ligase A